MLAALAACRTPRDATELYGTYVAEYPFGKDKLILKPGGEYFQEVTITGKAAVATTTGRWSYEPATGYITLKNPLVVADALGKLQPNYDKPFVGDAGLPVIEWFFRDLLIGGDEGVQYKKISSG